MGTRPSVRRIPGLISHTDICVWSAATTAVVVSAVVFQPHGGLWRAHREELGGREGMERGWRGGNVSVFQAHTQQKAAASRGSVGRLVSRSSRLLNMRLPAI